MRRRVTVTSMMFLVLASLVGAACGGSSKTASAPMAGTGGAAQGAPDTAASPGGGARSQPLAPPAGLPALAARVIKTANVSLRLRDGSFEQRFQEATQIAGRYGGYVSSSETAGGKRRSGMLVLRVPAAQFESALGAIKSLGTVSDERLSGQDVTSQFVDLEARLRNWQSQEAVLLTLMSKATSIQDSIRVQNQLQDIQLTIEELKGQLRVLNDQADLSTITVAMAEVGFIAPSPKARPALSRAWHQAVDGFVGVIATVVVGLGYLIPLAILALIVWGLARRLGPKVGSKVTRPA
jgi:hypothetical protein